MKPSIPKGTRDFLPEEMAKRNYIFSTIKDSFRLYGFNQIETPSIENLSTLMGKYGEEGDKLLFKILNSGDYLRDLSEEELIAKNSSKIITKISEKGLRYDLTVPFARFVVQYRDKITFPFKRYQIQPVWRADRPQKGRYREFFQCDADVVGSDSLLNEVELIQLIDEVFSKLKINVAIKLNNRKILSGIAELIGEADKVIDITVAIDKLDKIGLENVTQELLSKGITEKAIAKLKPILTLSGNNASKLETLKGVLTGSEVGLTGISEIETILDITNTLQLNSSLEIDLTLARGLNYYTGSIIEVQAKDVEMGSIAGGGRYDNLTGIFGMEGVSGVGISFGADRIYDVLNQLDLYPSENLEKTKALFLNFGGKEFLYCLPLLKKMRDSGINAEIYPDVVKLKKQMSYADAKGIKYVIIAGETEVSENVVTIKNMLTGNQDKVTLEDLIAKIN